MSGHIGYKLTHDSGFAPNPFHGYLTLATCKPAVRRARQRGEWVAGFASKELVDRSSRDGIDLPFQGLIYLARVEEVMPLHDYFHDPRFRSKQPKEGRGTLVERCGDNIYYREPSGRHYLQLRNEHHPPGETDHDTGGRNALVASEFYYFGRNAFMPEGGWRLLLGHDLSSGRTFGCQPSFVEKVLKHLAQLGIKPGIHGMPSGFGADVEGQKTQVDVCKPRGGACKAPPTAPARRPSRC
ncbi:hypothetical protein WKW79_31415 [Variovorax robiniae]|uniref:Nucleotide modification associated domain-containing protein n=1 Tax=Variovorax robiniae TaxID=1836199 RepID=A0ABU8XK98_9BURK